MRFHSNSEKSEREVLKIPVPPTSIQLHSKNRTCSNTRFTTGAERKVLHCCWSSIVSASACMISAARANVRSTWLSSPCFRYISPSSTHIDHSSPGNPTSSAKPTASCRCAIAASISPQDCASTASDRRLGIAERRLLFMPSPKRCTASLAWSALPPHSKAAISYQRAAPPSDRMVGSLVAAALRAYVYACCHCPATTQSAQSSLAIHPA